MNIQANVAPSPANLSNKLFNESKYLRQKHSLRVVVDVMLQQLNLDVQNEAEKEVSYVCGRI